MFEKRALWCCCAICRLSRSVLHCFRTHIAFDKRQTAAQKKKNNRSGVDVLSFFFFFSLLSKQKLCLPALPCTTQLNLCASTFPAWRAQLHNTKSGAPSPIAFFECAGTAVYRGASREHKQACCRTRRKLENSFRSDTRVHPSLFTYDLGLIGFQTTARAYGAREFVWVCSFCKLRAIQLKGFYHHLIQGFEFRF